MSTVTAQHAATVASILNNHAVKLTDSDKHMLFEIALAYETQVELQQVTFDAWVERVTLIKKVVEYT